MNKDLAKILSNFVISKDKEEKLVYSKCNRNSSYNERERFAMIIISAGFRGETVLNSLWGRTKAAKEQTQGVAAAWGIGSYEEVEAAAEAHRLAGWAARDNA